MARRGTFAFDLSKPLKRSRLLKQGNFHRAFKAREFILYPGFLVYYDNENAWRLDITKGETLGGRLGAVKLKGATVGIARNAPKACKYGLMVTAPDPANKRQSYLMNAASKEDRDAWIEAIRMATPTSPQQKRKEKPKEEPKKETSKENGLSPHPVQVERQTTACDAAVAVAAHTDAEEEQREVDEVASHITGSLQDMETSLSKRHNTATMAALALCIDETVECSTEDEPETSIDVIIGDMENTSKYCNGHSDNTRIDDVLGAQEDWSKSSEDGSMSTDSTSRVTSPASDMTSPFLLEPEQAPSTPSSLDTPQEEVEEATQLESRESIRKSQDDNGKDTVTTSVTVSCTSLDSFSSPKTEERSNHGENGEVREGEIEKVTKNDLSVQPEEEGRRSRTCSSTQVLINDDPSTISVTLNNYDSDDTLSEEESHTDLTVAEEKDDEESAAKGEETKGTSDPAPERSSLGIITVKEDRTGSSSSTSSNDSPTLKAPVVTRRRSSTPAVPFIEKKGFLYKMGGQRKTWKLRYFVLRPGAFQYFKDSASHKMLGEVKLKNLSIFYPGVGERKQSFQFKVHTESSWNRRPDYVLAAQSEREMKEWITAFKLAGQKAGSTSPRDSDEDSPK